MSVAGSGFVYEGMEGPDTDSAPDNDVNSDRVSGTGLVVFAYLTEDEMPGGEGGGSPGSGCDDCGITDTFDGREYLNQFGLSDSGLVWTAFSTAFPADLHGVTGGRMFLDISATAGPGARLPLAPALSTIARFDFEVTDVLPEGGVSLNILLTNGSFEFNIGDTGSLELAENGGSGTTTVSKTDWQADTVYHAILDYAQGSHQRMKVWPASDPEPSSWTAERTPNSVAAVTNVGFDLSSDANYELAHATVRIWIDNLDIEGVNRCTQFAFDHFNRSGSGTWGTSTFGIPWVTSTGGAGLSVANGVGLSAVGGVSPTQVSTVATASGSLWDNDEFEMLIRFSVSNVPDMDLIFGFDNPTPSTADRILQLRMYTNEIFFRSSPGTSSLTIPFSDWASGRWLFVRWHVVQNVSNKIRIWQEGDEEPTTWLIDAADGVNGESLVEFRVHPARAGSLAQSIVRVDYIHVQYDGMPCSLDAGECFEDTFTRVAEDAVGTSDSGHAWNAPGGTIDIDVDGSSLSMGPPIDFPAGGLSQSVTGTASVAIATCGTWPVETLIKARLPNGLDERQPSGASGLQQDSVSFQVLGTTGLFLADFGPAVLSTTWGFGVVGGGGIGTAPQIAFTDFQDWFWMRMVVHQNRALDAAVWSDGDSEPPLRRVRNATGTPLTTTAGTVFITMTRERTQGPATNNMTNATILEVDSMTTAGMQITGTSTGGGPSEPDPDDPDTQAEVVYGSGSPS